MDSLKVGARRTFEGFNALGELKRVLRVPFEPINLKEIRKTFLVPPQCFAGSEDSGRGAYPDPLWRRADAYRIEAVHIFHLPENV
jgi:hypothetical protein